MAIYYNGMYDIDFYKASMEVTRNSWKDFHLVPSERPHIEPPKPIYTLVTIPPNNLVLDLTDKNGGVRYEGSEGTFDFYIDHDKWDSWIIALHTLEAFFDGTLFRVRLNDKTKTKTYYVGTLKISSYTPGKDYSKISIGYNLNAPSTLMYCKDMNLYLGVESW